MGIGEDDYLGWSTGLGSGEPLGQWGMKASGLVVQATTPGLRPSWQPASAHALQCCTEYFPMDAWQGNAQSQIEDSKLLWKELFVLELRMEESAEQEYLAVAGEMCACYWEHRVLFCSSHLSNSNSRTSVEQLRPSASAWVALSSVLGIGLAALWGEAACELWLSGGPAQTDLNCWSGVPQGGEGRPPWADLPREMGYSSRSHGRGTSFIFQSWRRLMDTMIRHNIWVHNIWVWGFFKYTC